MLCFGAAFGSAVQSRLSLVISQMQFLLRDWLHIISQGEESSKGTGQAWSLPRF